MGHISIIHEYLVTTLIKFTAEHQTFEFFECPQIFMAIDYVNTIGAEPCWDSDSRGLKRRQQRRLKKRGNEAPLQNTPADGRTVILVLGGFLLTLFFVTKVALGL